MSSDPARGRRLDLLPSRPDLLDAAFVVVLGAIAVSGFRSTFTGYQFLVVAAAGLLLGLLAGHVAVALRAPWITVVVMAIAAFFLLGGAIALRADAVGGVIPTVRTWTGLADLSVNGWKQMLTTLPPIDGSGPLLTIPYIIGILAGAGTYTLARRTVRAWPPVVAMVVVLAAVVLLGTSRPADELVQGALFAVIGLAWLGVRNARRRPVASGGSGQLARLATAVVLLGLAGGVAVALGPVLPGADNPRTVLRSYVTPPFDIGQYPSPLVGFRKYTEHAKLAWDKELFTVEGLPQGEPLRIATLDGYDGAVWGATNGTGGVTGDPADEFQRIGTRIDTAATGRETSYTVTIGAEYERLPDLRAWVPSAGSVTAVSFGGARATSLDDGFRFNLATSSGVTSALLHEDDTIRLTSRFPASTVTKTDVASGVPTVGGDADGFTSAGVTKYAGKDATSGLAKLLAIGARMKSSGAYSDGGLPNEQIYLPGHSTGRLLDFLNRPQLVGTDEHYAATFALMANYLGVPARVVLGAVPEKDGAVKGKDVHAWVEVRVGAGHWSTVPYALFTPDRNQRPKTQPPVTAQKANAAVVPPPNVTRPRSSLDEAAQLAANSQRLGRKRGAGDTGGVPAWIVAIATYGGPPIAAILLVAGGIVGAKVVRRRRRRARSVVAERYGSGWTELLDTLRDLGVAAPAGQTRREQAAALARTDVTRVAVAADQGVFGPEQPSESATSVFWSQVDDARRAALRSVGRWHRVRAALSIRSFLPRRAVAS